MRLYEAFSSLGRVLKKICKFRSRGLTKQIYFPENPKKSLIASYAGQKWAFLQCGLFSRAGECKEMA
jgi:hypothetical protein